MDAVTHAIDDAPPYPGGGTVAIQIAKSRKYSAAASLFRLDVSRFPSAIRTLLTPCPGIAGCPVGSGTPMETGLAAAAWTVSRRDTRGLELEHVRLWGGRDPRREMPLVPACACSYLSAEVDGTIEDVIGAYQVVGFRPRADEGRCPAHISNELEYMAYCMESAVRGDETTLLAARAFMRSHLFSWGVVFAAATYARAEHPVIRFAGEILEHLLFCDYEQARNAAAAYRPLARSTVPRAS